MPRFIVDNNVGRLATWLRALGYDTVFINPIDDGVLVNIAKDEGRIILTKDTGILQRSLITSGAVTAFYVQGIQWKEQLRNVVRAFSLTAANGFTRCLECNSLIERVKSADARGQIPEDVFEQEGDIPLPKL